MKIDVLTLFPEMFEGFLNTSIIKRARDNDLIDGNDLMDNKNRGLMDDFKDEGLILDPIDFDSLNKEGIKPADDSDLSKIKSLINKRFKNDK